MNYRNATYADLPAIVNIYNAAISSRTVTADTTHVTTASRKAWFDQHIPEKHPLWILEDPTHNLIAWASLQAYNNRPAYNATAEVSIYIHESYQHKGLGKVILQHCIDNAPALGIKTLLSCIFAHNVPAIKLFTSAGFREWGYLPNIARIDNTERSLCILGKRLTT